MSNSVLSIEEANQAISKENQVKQNTGAEPGQEVVQEGQQVEQDKSALSGLG